MWPQVELGHRLKLARRVGWPFIRGVRELAVDSSPGAH